MLKQRPKPAPFYTAANLSTQSSVGYLMKQAVSSIRKQADTGLAEHDLTYALWQPLYKVYREPGHSAATLARELDMDPPTVTRSLDRLEAKGLLLRERSSADRRIINLTLTPEGRQAASRVPQVLAEVLNGHLSGFTAEEWQTLVQLLQRMVANGEAIRATSPAPAPGARE